MLAMPRRTHGCTHASTNARTHAHAQVRLWDLGVFAEAAVLTGHSSVVLSVAFNHDGSLLASSSNDGTVRLWDVATGQQLQVGVWGAVFRRQG